MLLLDIDGVLNPFAAPHCPIGYTEHDVFPGEEPVRLCRANGEWIAELTDTFEVVWASAWGRSANQLLGPLLGLPALAHVDLPPTPFSPAMKVPSVIRHLRDRPAVWIDDVITPEARNWAAARPTPTLLLVVDPATGLTRHTVDTAPHGPPSKPAPTHRHAPGRDTPARPGAEADIRPVPGGVPR